MIHNKHYSDYYQRDSWVQFPTDRFLHSRVGRDWNLVHKELSSIFPRNTYPGNRFWSSFDSHYHPTVATNCWIGEETGRAYTSKDEVVDGFYAHPFSGKLSYQIDLNSWRHKRKIAKKNEDRIVIDDKRAYEKINGIWFYTEYIKDTSPSYAYYFGPFLHEHKGYLIKSQRQLSKKHLRSLGLKNNTADEIVSLLKEKAKKEEELKAKEKEWAQRWQSGH